MLETLLCSLITILPDYLYRRYGQGKRIGKEITLYSVWFELRWGITACLLLTVSLITMIFYYHPSTTNVTAAFRTVAVIPEVGGRVEEVYVKPFQKVKAGDLLFKLDSARQQATLETARKRIAEVDAQVVVAQSELVTADANISQVETALNLARDDLSTQVDLQRRNPGGVARREIDRLGSAVQSRESELAAAVARKQTLQTRIGTLLPAEKASAEAQAAEAQNTIDKTLVKAGVDGTLQQFTLRVGEVVNPLLRPAGVLVPDDSGRERLVAGFGQIETQVLKVGMIGEVTCIARPFTHHAVDATALVHAAILRMQAVVAPVQILVLSGH